MTDQHQSPDSESESTSRNTFRIEDLGRLKHELTRRLGSSVYLHDLEFRENGRALAYLGVVLTRDTTANAGQNERTSLNYAPVGAAYVRTDDEYVVSAPSRDALEAALDARQRRENAHRATVLPALKNRAEKRSEMHSERVEASGLWDDDVDGVSDLDLSVAEAFELGQDVGALQEASGFRRVLVTRWDEAYRGLRRFDAPDYQVIRRRRCVEPSAFEAAGKASNNEPKPTGENE